MASIDGIVLASYEVHCRKCEQANLGLGRTRQEALAALARYGWTCRKRRWFCPDCTPWAFANYNGEPSP
jgi:hypothetical protein